MCCAPPRLYILLLSDYHGGYLGVQYVKDIVKVRIQVAMLLHELLWYDSFGAACIIWKPCQFRIMATCQFRMCVCMMLYKREYGTCLHVSDWRARLFQCWDYVYSVHRLLDQCSMSWTDTVLYFNMWFDKEIQAQRDIHPEYTVDKLFADYPVATNEYNRQLKAVEVR